MFLVSCYYTVSSFSCSADVSSKNLYRTGPIDVASFPAAWNRQAQFVFPHPPSLIHLPHFLLVHISFLVSTHFLPPFSLFLSIEFPYFVHPSFFFRLYPYSLWCFDILKCTSVCVNAYKISKFFTISTSRGI